MVLRDKGCVKDTLGVLWMWCKRAHLLDRSSSDVLATLTLVLDMQWLVFRKDGATTAGQWAQEAAQYASQSGFLAVFDRGKAQRQQAFVKEVLRQTMKVRP